MYVIRAGFLDRGPGFIASLMGAIKIESHGTQNHAFTMDEFKNRYKENFGELF